MEGRLKRLLIYTDGVARGNPGEAGIGIVIKDEKGNALEEISEYIGVTTNNVAEYKALITSLAAAEKYEPERIEIFSDSELMVRQLNGVYRVRDKKLSILFREALRLKSRFPELVVTHITRDKNKDADALANRAVDLKGVLK